MYSADDLEIAFLNWLVDYEVCVTERWDRLQPDEWNILANAQWLELRKLLKGQVDEADSQ
jgi:hypothetical protein